MRKGRVYASHSPKAFHVDACIPRLYIAHGSMTHNESSPSVFRMRSLRIFLLGTILMGIFLGFSAPARKASPGKADSRTKLGIDVLARKPELACWRRRILRICAASASA